MRRGDRLLRRRDRDGRRRREAILVLHRRAIGERVQLAKDEVRHRRGAGEHNLAPGVSILEVLEPHPELTVDSRASRQIPDGKRPRHDSGNGEPDRSGQVQHWTALVQDER